MYKIFKNIVEDNKGKSIAIFSHGAAITFLLMKWCKLVDVDSQKTKCMKFKDKIVLNKKMEAPEVFKIIIDEKQNIKDIENLIFKY